MVNPLARQTHDLALIRKAPESALDLRAPVAAEESLDSQILLHFAKQSRRQSGWTSYPKISFSQTTRRLSIEGGRAIVSIYPGEIEVNTDIVLTLLPSIFDTYKQTNWLYLVAFAAEVGEEQDPVLGQLSFSGSYQNGTEVVSVTKENSRRLRAFWLLVLSNTTMTAEAFTSLLPVSGDLRGLTINTALAGFELGNKQVYARDANLSSNFYPIFPDTIQLIELCQLRRWQNYNDRGYVYGRNGENLNTLYSLTNTAPLILTQDIETAMRLRLRQLFSGTPGRSNTLGRTVQNLTASSVGNNPGFPGESAGSPNGSVCLANGQRISFTNQAIIEKLGCQVVTVDNNGFGSPVISTNLNSAPQGSFFSANRSDHRIFSSAGVEQAERGSFSNLGGGGTLIWTGDANSTITPGSAAYIQPGIFYPAGSGFNVPFSTIEQAWRSSSGGSPVSVAAANIRAADSADIDQYTDPTNGEDYFVVHGRERAALHYILKRITVTVNANGVAVVPTGSRGCFAFIQGVNGRINAPVYAGLTPNATVKALVYYPPLTTEVWQFLMTYAEYQGTGSTEPDFLTGATIISKPLSFIHTQGGGSSVFQGDADTRLTPITMHLPSVIDLSVPPYRFNARVQVVGEPRQGPITLREYPLLSAPGLALPAPGQILSLLPASKNQSRSLNARLTSNGQPLGFRTPSLVGQAEFQAVVAFAVEKAGDRRLVILTRNTIGGENVAADSDLNTAIDTFRL